MQTALDAPDSRPAAGDDNSMTANKKDPYDKTSTARGARLANEIKAAGGAVFTTRCKTSEQLAQLDGLVTAGYGVSRNDVILKLIAEKAKKIL